MDRLFLLLLGSPDTDVQQVSWHLSSSKEAIKKSNTDFTAGINRGTGTIEDFVGIYNENFHDVDISVIIPGEQVTYTDVALTVKNPRQMLQALPFLVEEQVIGNIEDMHIAIPQTLTGEAIRIAIVEKIFLDKLKALFTRYELTVNEVFGLPDLLIHDNGELHILLNDDFALVRSLNNCFQCEHGNLNTILELISWDDISKVTISLQELNKVSLSVAKKIKMTFGSELIKVTSAVFTENMLDVLLREENIALVRPLNIWQGEFSSTNTTNQALLQFAPVAWVALLCLFLQVGFNVASGFYFGQLSGRIEMNMAIRYLKLFPDEKKVVDLEAQLTGKMNASNSGTKGSQFSTMFATTVNAMSKLGNKNDFHLKQFRYDEESGELKIGLDTNSIALLDKIKNKLAESNFVVEIISANEESGTIKATLLIKHV